MKRTWWKEAVVYQVYWRSFSWIRMATDMATWKFVRRKLPYIKELGADLVWLNPFYVSPDRDNGYDIADNYSVMDKAGTMTDFERLLEEAHAIRLKVILDLVVNHMSDQHPQFLEAKTSITSAKRDYYIWHDPIDGEAPNNWRSYFTPSCWKYEAKSEQYYYHSFAVEQPDLNWENEALRNKIYTMMRFWLDKRIDGFRMDVINQLATLTHTLPGMPYIYQGEEIGMTGVVFDSIDDYQNIAMKNRYSEEVAKGRNPQEVLSSLQPLSRDNSRKMQWNDSTESGFTDGVPWMRVKNYVELNVEMDLRRENSVFRYYQELIHLRKTNEALVYGDFKDLLPEHPVIHAYEHHLDEDRFMIVLNHSDEDVVLPLSPDFQDMILQNVSNETDTLRPYEARIYKTKNSS